MVYQGSTIHQLAAPEVPTITDLRLQLCDAVHELGRLATGSSDASTDFTQHPIPNSWLGTWDFQCVVQMVTNQHFPWLIHHLFFKKVVKKTLANVSHAKLYDKNDGPAEFEACEQLDHICFTSDEVASAMDQINA